MQSSLKNPEKSDKLQFYLEKTLNQTHTDVALLLKFMYKRFLKYSNNDKKWFYFETKCNKWLIFDKNKSPVYELMSKHIVNEFLYLSNIYTNQVCEALNDGENSMEDADKSIDNDFDEITINDLIAKSKLCSEICLKLTNKTFCSRVNTIVEKILESDDFIDVLDKRPHLLGFKNGVYDFAESRFREAYPEDLLSMNLDYDYNSIVNQLSYDPKVIEEIKMYFNSLVDDSELLINSLKNFLDGSKSGPIYVWLNYNDITNYEDKTENSDHIIKTTQADDKELNNHLYNHYLTEFMENIFEKYFGILPAWILRKRKICPGTPMKELCSVIRKRICLVLHDNVNEKEYNTNTLTNFLEHNEIEIRDIYKDAIKCRPQFGIILATTKSDLKINELNLPAKIIKIKFRTKLPNSNQQNLYTQDYLKDKYPIWKNHLIPYLLSH